MKGANGIIKYVCMECFKEFALTNKEEAIQHTNFAHKNITYLKEVKDES